MYLTNNLGYVRRIPGYANILQAMPESYVLDILHYHHADSAYASHPVGGLHSLLIPISTPLASPPMPCKGFMTLALTGPAG